MASISSDEIRESVRRILKGADLASLSSKKVRRMLEGEYEADFTERKQEIDDILMKAISEEEDSQNSQASNGKSPPDHSASESSDSELEPEPPKKKAKVVAKAEIKKTPKKKPSPRAYLSDDEGHSGVDDAELAKQLQEEESEGRRSRHRSVKKSPVQKKPKKKREKDPSRAGKSTYSQPCALSADLATIMGTDRMARKDVVKRMWEIVKERKLEDPKNRQFMVCDDELFKVFGKRRVRTFGMMKFLKTHIKDMKDIVE